MSTLIDNIAVLPEGAVLRKGKRLWHGKYRGITCSNPDFGKLVDHLIIIKENEDAIDFEIAKQNLKTELAGKK